MYISSYCCELHEQTSGYLLGHQNGIMATWEHIDSSELHIKS